MGGRGASSSSNNNGLYEKLVNDAHVVRVMIDSVKARQFDNPNAKIGDTSIDTDNLLSGFADKLSTKEYANFDMEKGEKALFKKLKQLEKDYGFKK